EGIIRGIHRVHTADEATLKAQILASGIAVPCAIEAADILLHDWNVSADVWSVTSWGELQRDGLAAENHNFDRLGDEAQIPYLTQKLQDVEGPFVAVSDWATLVPEQVRPFIPGRYAVLGADGFGYSDTRAAARRDFKIDRES